MPVIESKFEQECGCTVERHAADSYNPRQWVVTKFCPSHDPDAPWRGKQGHWEYSWHGKWRVCDDLHYDPVTDVDLALECPQVGVTEEHRFVEHTDGKPTCSACEAKAEDEEDPDHDERERLGL